MNHLIGIYKITSPSGRMYIGQSVNIKSRFSKYRSLACKEQPLLYRSFKKYGVQNHSFEILCECLRSELDEKEKYYIELFNTFNSKKGLNLQDGGYNRFSFSESVRKKQSETRKRLGIRPPVNFGKDNVNYGKPVSEEKKQRQRQTLKIYHSNLSPEEKQRLSEKQSNGLKESWRSGNFNRQEKFGKNHHGSKPVVQLTKIGRFIKEWDCAREAAITLNLDVRNISLCVRGKRPTHGGFQWMFKNLHHALSC